MNYSNIMEEIKSTRDYKETVVKSELLKEIISAGDTALENHGLDIVLFEDGEQTKQKLEGKAGYFGKFIGAPHYIAVLSDDGRKSKEDAAYIMEMMRFKAHKEGLGSCWITIPNTDEIKADLGIDAARSLCGFLAIGYRYAGIFKKDIQEKAFRQGAIEITYMDEWGNTPAWEDLEARGLDQVFYLTRFAPSWGNKQPWKFLILKNHVILAVEKDSSTDTDLDTGIIKFYFEKACVDKGLSLQTAEASGEFNIPESYEIRAVYNI